LLPVDPRPIIGRARLKLSAGKSQLALKLVNEAVLLAPESFDAWVFKAMFHRDHQHFPDALDAFEKALAINPTSGRALTARAALWMDLGQTDNAKADLLQVENLASDTLETIYLRTSLMFRDGKSEEARELLRESSDEIKLIKEEFRSKMPTTRLMLGVVSFFEQNYNEAIVNLKTFLGAFPNHLGAKRYLASAYLAVG
jgi:tetratricopeptide (TPR) repeat protein